MSGKVSRAQSINTQVYRTCYFINTAISALCTQTRKMLTQHCDPPRHAWQAPGPEITAASCSQRACRSSAATLNHEDLGTEVAASSPGSHSLLWDPVPFLGTKGR